MMEINEWWGNKSAKMCEMDEGENIGVVGGGYGGSSDTKEFNGRRDEGTRD